MKALLLAALLTTSAHAVDLTIGKSERDDSMNASVGFDLYTLPIGTLSGEVEYVDFGDQPHTVTHNRALNLNLKGSTMFTDKIEGYAKVGLTSTTFSSPYNKFDWDKGFVGWNVGAGLNYYLTKSLYAQVNVQNLHYQQCSQDKFNDYLYWSLGVGYDFSARNP